MTKQIIKVCSKCESPLVWTFAFAYNEVYCINCGAMGDMFYGNDAVATTDLKLQLKLVENIWEVIYGKGWFIPRSRFTKSNCIKCKNTDDHREHLTSKEKMKDILATTLLKKSVGIFDMQNN